MFYDLRDAAVFAMAAEAAAQHVREIVVFNERGEADQCAGVVVNAIIDWRLA